MIPPTPIICPPTPSPVDKRGIMGSMKRRTSSGSGSGIGTGSGSRMEGRKSLDSVKEVKSSKNEETQVEVKDQEEEEVIADSPEDEEEPEMVTSPQEEEDDPISFSSFTEQQNTTSKPQRHQDENIVTSPDSLQDQPDLINQDTKEGDIASSPDTDTPGSSFDALHRIEAKEDVESKRRETIKGRRRGRTSGLEYNSHGMGTGSGSLSSKSSSSSTPSRGGSTILPPVKDRKSSDDLSKEEESNDRSRADYGENISSSPEQTMKPLPQLSTSSQFEPSRSNTAFSDPPTASPPPRKADTLTVAGMHTIERAYDSNSLRHGQSMYRRPDDLAGVGVLAGVLDVHVRKQTLDGLIAIGKRCFA